MRAKKSLLATVGLIGLALLCHAPAFAANLVELPDAYYPLLEAGVAQVADRLASEPNPTLQGLESHERHFPHVLLAAAVLYARSNPANHHYHDPRTLELALRIGDLLARENAAGTFTGRLDHHRDTYMWLEAYRLLAPELGAERRARWAEELKKNIAGLAADASPRVDLPVYSSPFLITSPNHFASWCATIYLGGQVFGNKSWQALASRVLHRYATEQSVDGYWGEHDPALPTTGYDHVTYTAVALYYELSRDPAARQAVKCGLRFHEYFTYPDGTPVEVINDRNRYWEVDSWGHFGFSNFPDGRRYAEFLTGFYRSGSVTYEDLGRFAQDALYYHAGPRAPIPQDLANYSQRLSVPAGIRKSGPWVVCLSGLISTQAPLSQFYLDRQSSLSVYHEKLGLIVTGANSKRQPELATFKEEAEGQVFYLPQISKLDMGDTADRLALAYNTFFSELRVPRPTTNRVELQYVLTRKSRQEIVHLNLQLCLKPSEPLETAKGKMALSDSPLSLGPDELGGWISHHGWKLCINRPASLTWPVYPYNPYSDAPEKSLDHAVGVLSVPVKFTHTGEADTGGLDKVEIRIVLEAE